MNSGGIFLIQDNDTLVEMNEQPYQTEDHLQELLARYPRLLAGEQMDSGSPRRWLLISRETPLPDAPEASGRWSVDLLFLDQDGVPTLVEVKRSSDTRIRREVVGQMLDYAANAVVHWPVEAIIAQFQTTCEKTGADPNQLLGELLATDETDRFWKTVDTNLTAGRIRLVFVADIIPIELQRVIEFLNVQMNPTEVLGVGLRQYVGQGTYTGVKTLVPRLIGKSARPRGVTASPAARIWDESAFFEDLTARRGAGEAEVARQILSWAVTKGMRVRWGKGASTGSFLPILDRNGKEEVPFSVWTYGSIEIQRTPRPPFNDELKRQELVDRLQGIPGVGRFPADAINRTPILKLSALTDPASIQQFVTVSDWLLDQLQNA